MNACEKPREDFPARSLEEEFRAVELGLSETYVKAARGAALLWVLTRAEETIRSNEEAHYALLNLAHEVVDGQIKEYSHIEGLLIKFSTRLFSRPQAGDAIPEAVLLSLLQLCADGKLDASNQEDALRWASTLYGHACRDESYWPALDAVLRCLRRGGLEAFIDERAGRIGRSNCLARVAREAMNG